MSAQGNWYANILARGTLVPPRFFTIRSKPISYRLEMKSGLFSVHVERDIVQQFWRKP